MNIANSYLYKDLLAMNEIRRPIPVSYTHLVELQKIMDKEGKGEKLEAWDWWFYTEKLRKEKYNLEEDEIKP